jgi:hypothetical protein
VYPVYTLQYTHMGWCRALGILVLALFLGNVLTVAVGSPMWTRPLHILAVGVDHLVDGARWIGTHVGHLVVWLATQVSYMWDHLGPALRESVRDIVNISLAGFWMSLEFAHALGDAVAASRPAQLLIHPYALVTLVILATLGSLGYVFRARLSVYLDALSWVPAPVAPPPPVPDAASAKKASTKTSKKAVVGENE